MKKRETIPGTVAAPLLYWLLVVGGLAVLTAVRMSMRFEDVASLGPLWVGAILGTALGQVLASRRIRPWLATFIVANAMWMGPLLILPIWTFFFSTFTAHNSWAEVEVALMAFAPAAACGYASLTERGALPAFWFPAMLWVLAILDGGGDTALAHAQGTLLLAALSGLFLAFLGARETRRAALWQAHATTRLGTAGRRVVLREAPLRFMGRAGWVSTLGAATLLLTAWIAPHLWQKEKTERPSMQPVSGAGKATSAGTEPEESCCSDSMDAEVQSSRVREYFPVHRTHDRSVATPSPTRCVACRDGVPIRVPTTDPAPAVASTSGGDWVASSGAVDVTTTPGATTGTFVPPRPSATALPLATTTAPRAAPVSPPPPVMTAVPPTPPPPAPVAVVKAAPASSSVPVTASPGPGMTIAVIGPAQRPIAPAPPEESLPLGWLLSASLSLLVVNVAQRPLRRMLFLRHLRRPLWPETVDQRVSNLWQWMLVGLRDAGFHVIPGEQPQELARRVGIEGMKACATVLERARHGVRVDAADLEAMIKAAGSVYDSARARAGWMARAVSWLRWPLV